MAYAKVANGLSNFKKKHLFQAKHQPGLSRTFILPTLFGGAFGCVSFVLLLMAIGYANNLIYFFICLLDFHNDTLYKFHIHTHQHQLMQTLVTKDKKYIRHVESDEYKYQENLCPTIIIVHSQSMYKLLYK